MTCNGISSAELMKRTGITFRQLDYWARVGYIEPHNHSGRENGNPGSGHQRCWSPGEIAKVKWFTDLTQIGGLEHERTWLLLNHPERIQDWIKYLADLHYKLTGQGIAWQPYEVTDGA